MSVVDLGCGSGRLPSALGKSFQIDYCGIDVVEELLAYARTKSPANYRFVKNHTLTIPAPDASADIISGFSVFTHLLHAETYLYMKDMRRVLKSGGALVFSFLEFTEATHWPIFEATVAAQSASRTWHLNTFIERGTIDLWCSKLGYKCEQFIDSTAAPYGPEALGQSVAVLRAV